MPYGTRQTCVEDRRKIPNTKYQKHQLFVNISSLAIASSIASVTKITYQMKFALKGLHVRQRAAIKGIQRHAQDMP